MMESRVAVVVLLSTILILAPRSLGAERVVVSEHVTVIRPGDRGSVFILLKDNQIPLIGYSVELSVRRLDGAKGSVSLSVSETTFNDERNVITANGKTRDPDFSLVTESSRGLFISTNTVDSSGVLAGDGADALAKVELVASSDAQGRFRIALERNSVLSDEEAKAIAFDFDEGIVEISESPCSGQVLADANCDGAVNFDDIDCFIASLVNNKTGWDQCNHGEGCDFFCVNDIDRNGSVNFDDIDGFVECLVNDGCP